MIVAWCGSLRSRRRACFQLLSFSVCLSVSLVFVFSPFSFGSLSCVGGQGLRALLLSLLPPAHTSLPPSLFSLCSVSFSLLTSDEWTAYCFQLHSFLHGLSVTCPRRHGSTWNGVVWCDVGVVCVRGVYDVCGECSMHVLRCGCCTKEQSYTSTVDRYLQLRAPALP